jgi:hypothetical protein
MITAHTKYSVHYSSRCYVMAANIATQDWLDSLSLWSLLCSLSTDCIEHTASKSSSIVACLFVAMETCVPLSSIGRIHLFLYFSFSAIMLQYITHKFMMMTHHFVTLKRGIHLVFHLGKYDTNFFWHDPSWKAKSSIRKFAKFKNDKLIFEPKSRNSLLYLFSNILDSHMPSSWVSCKGYSAHCICKSLHPAVNIIPCFKCMQCSC